MARLGLDRENRALTSRCWPNLSFSGILRSKKLREHARGASMARLGSRQRESSINQPLLAESKLLRYPQVEELREHAQCWRVPR